jgi:hypothetical protein
MLTNAKILEMQWSTVEFGPTVIDGISDVRFIEGKGFEFTANAHFDQFVNVRNDPKATFETMDVNEDSSGEDAETDGDQASGDTSI